MAESEVVITGAGCVSPHGRGVRKLWQGLLDGRSALSPLTIFDASMFRNPLAGVATEYATSDGETPRAFRMLDDALVECLRDALGLESATPKNVCDAIARIDGLRHAAIVTGTNFGAMSAAEHALVTGRGDISKAGLNDYLFGAAGQRVAKQFGIGGPQFSLSLSCASGTAAIAMGFDLIRRGRADAVLACGYDELSLYVYAGLSALRAITPETLRPFDKRRKGTLFSEGAGVVLLESAAHAADRKAPKIYARIVGRALNNDAYHMTAPEQEAHGIQRLMRTALADAKLQPEQIDHLNLHATGTPYNDAIETKAVHAVFGNRGRTIPVCSVKSSIGHCMGAAGSIEAIAALLTIRDGKVPPVLGLDLAEKDPQCDLNTPTGTPLVGAFNTVMKTSYGFGGTNAAVIFSKVPA